MDGIASCYRQEVETGRTGFDFHCLPRSLGLVWCRSLKCYQFRIVMCYRNCDSRYYFYQYLIAVILFNSQFNTRVNAKANSDTGMACISIVTSACIASALASTECLACTDDVRKD